MNAVRSFSMLQPGPMLNENDRLHWRARASRVKVWREAAYWNAIAAYGNQGHLPPCTIDVALPLRYRRKADPSNWIPTLKACVDGLVDASWWEDDSAEYITILEPTLVVGATLVTITARQR